MQVHEFSMAPKDTIFLHVLIKQFPEDVHLAGTKFDDFTVKQPIPILAFYGV